MRGVRLVVVVVVLFALAPVPVAAGKALYDQAFSPAPGGAAYATVWASMPTTITLTFGEGIVPVGPIQTVFTENDVDGEPVTATALFQSDSGTWQATFALPRPGIWNGQHVFGAKVGPDGAPTVLRPPQFALRVLPAESAGGSGAQGSSLVALLRRLVGWT